MKFANFVKLILFLGWMTLGNFEEIYDTNIDSQLNEESNITSSGEQISSTQPQIDIPMNNSKINEEGDIDEDDLPPKDFKFNYDWTTNNIDCNNDCYNIKDKCRRNCRKQFRNDKDSKWDCNQKCTEDKNNCEEYCVQSSDSAGRAIKELSHESCKDKMLNCVKKCGTEINDMGKCIKQCLPVKGDCEEKEKIEKEKLQKERERKKSEDL